MATKHYCDRCDKEVTDDKVCSHGRARFMLDGITVELVVAVAGTWNAGHVCLECLKAVVAGGEVRFARDGGHAPPSAIILKREKSGPLAPDSAERGRRVSAVSREERDRD